MACTPKAQVVRTTVLFKWPAFEIHVSLVILTECTSALQRLPYHNFGFKVSIRRLHGALGKGGFTKEVATLIMGCLDL